MPGAPNRPPSPDAPVATTPVVPVAAARVALRRLAPMRVALRLDLWKNAPSRDLLTPFERAETAYAAGDFVNTESALDQLAVRFAEPRWPSLPLPFRLLRVAIPAPMPPHWDPDFALPQPEKEAKKARKSAELGVALAEGTLAWASTHAVAAEDLRPLVDAAKTALDGAALEPVLEPLDQFWEAIRERIPAPGAPPVAAPRPVAPVPEPSAEEA
ncbi:MAG: hypothetical protein L3K15_00505 [Thermoplasmata archaeon]|nr:hypothetical protein [Thermoplasmata archaeon]